MDSYFSNWKADQEFVSLYTAFDKLTNQNDCLNAIDNPMYSRLYILMQLAKQQGDKDANFAESGVYAGMSMFFTAQFCKNTFVGIDSFDGVSSPGVHDTEYFNKIKLKLDMNYAKNVLKNYNNVVLHKGWIPNVFSEITDAKYSFVHIDVDLYEPTKYSIEYFWPKIILGGVLICDDFGSEKTIGARKAMIDYFKKINILELPTGQALVFKNA